MEVTVAEEHMVTVTNRETTFNVERANDDDWECDCGFRAKSGLPCEHLLKVLWFTREFTYAKYILPRWIIRAKHEESLPVVPRGRPRNSRRNLLR